MKLIQLAVIVTLTAAVSGCKTTQSSGPGATGTSESTQKRDGEDAFQRADKLLEKKYYEQAIEEFERLRNAYPFSQYAVESELRIADALFAKGDYAAAADAYRTFARLHPKHKQIDYSTFRIGLSLFKDAPKSVDRDQTSVERALAEFRSFLTRFPDSEHAEKATSFVKQGRERLAEKELYIGRFYFRDEAWKACIPRFQTVVERYPETDAAMDGLFFLAKAQFLDGRTEGARKSLEEFVERYPESEYRGEADRMLRSTNRATGPKESPGTAQNNAKSAANGE